MARALSLGGLPNSGLAFNAPHPPRRYCASHPYIVRRLILKACLSGFHIHLPYLEFCPLSYNRILSLRMTPDLRFAILEAPAELEAKPKCPTKTIKKPSGKELSKATMP